MNNKDAIGFLGEREGARLRIGNSVDDVNTSLPYFRINKDASGSYTFEGFNYKTHDNAERMPFILNFLKQYVVPYLSKEADIKGYYNIELHDSNSYLDGSYTNTLVWSRNKSDRHSILIPDVYQLTNYGNKLLAKDGTEWHAKQNRIAFYGTTTGNRDPSQNARLQWCKWKAVNDPDDAWCHWYITNVAQMQVDDIVKAYGMPVWQQMLKPYVPHTYLYNYKFNLDIPGNTASWDRVPVVLNSKSLLFKAPCQDMCFYYPLMHAGEHYIHVDTPQDAIKQQQYFLSNMKDYTRINTNANNFVADYMTPHAAIRYMVTLFETSSFFSSK
jgi:hypothetical protein